MFDLDSWSEIWATITRNKLRSFLTGFGVFWGLFMLIILIGLGNAFQGGLASNFDGFASNACFFNTGRTSVAYKGFRKGRWWNMTNRDIDLIRERANTVDLVSPMLFGGGGDKNVVRGRKSGSYGYRGVYGEHFKIEQMYTLKGRLINELDNQDTRKVCVIGKTVYETLFDMGEDPIGEVIRLNGIYFQVIGVISPKSNASIGGRPEESVFIPFRTMQLTFNQGDIVHFLACTTKPGIAASAVEEQVSTILKAANHIAPDDNKALYAFNIEKQFQLFNNLFLGVDFLIWIVGIGALFSGIIGISNIMMVTVRERTREIGVRRAIGAKPRSIVMQIVSESFVLTAISGVLGFLVGVLLLEGISSVMSMSPSTGEEGFFIEPFISFRIAVVAIIILILSGIASGLMPAYRALKIKAIDAIRDE